MGNPEVYKPKDIYFEWGMGRQLEGVYNLGLNNEKGTQLLQSYAYNDNGLRISKTVNEYDNSGNVVGTTTTRFTWTEGNLTCQSDGINYLYFRYDSDGNVVSFEYNGQDYYYIKNLQGDVTEIIDSEGNVVVRYEYDAWGYILSITDDLDNLITVSSHVGIMNPMRYRGYYYDNENEFVYVTPR